MCRGARDEIDLARVRMAHERADDISSNAVPRGSHFEELLDVEVRDGAEALVALQAMRLALGEFLHAAEVRIEASPQEIVAQHRGERGRERHRERERDSAATKPIECAEKR